MSPRPGFQNDVSQTTSYIKYIQIARCPKPKLVAKCALAVLPRIRVQIVRCTKPKVVAECGLVSRPRSGVEIVRCPKPKLVAKCTLVPLPRRGGSDWTLSKTEVSRTVRLWSKSKGSDCTLHKNEISRRVRLGVSSRSWGSDSTFPTNRV